LQEAGLAARFSFSVLQSKGDFMKRKNLMLTVAASAVLGAFGPAFAGGGAKHSSADASYPSTEQSASASGASRSDDMNVRGSVSVDRETGDTQPSTESKSMEQSSVGPQASTERSQDVDPRTGLDRAHPAN
jgi:hypothetical protein